MSCPSPCPGCPWLIKNHGKPSPEIVAELRKNNLHIWPWYTVTNARRLWSGIRRGEPMLCHETDPKASRYGGKDATSGHERMCVGMMILVAKHVNGIQTFKSFKDYTAANPLGFTRRGFSTWLDRLLFNPKIPLAFSGADQVGVPWKDKLINTK